MERRQKLVGIVLRRSDFGEADKIVTIMSKEKGKVRLLAKGVRKIKSRRAPHLELFNQVDVSVHSGKTWNIITEANTIQDFSEIKANLELTAFGFYLAEVLDRLLPEEEPHEKVYFSYIGALRELCELKKETGNKKAESIIKEFVIQLLWELGFLPRGEFPKEGVTNFVEEVIERRVKSKEFIEEI